MKLNKKRKQSLLDAFKWANSELKTGRSMMAIFYSWGGSTYNDLIDYYELAKEMGEEKIVKALKKEFKNNIRRHESEAAGCSPKIIA